jgi:Tfp pilus assembly protein PilO
MIAFLDKISRKEKIGLAVALSIVAIAFVDRVVVSPIQMKIKEMDQEILFKEKALGRDLRNLNRKEMITREYETFDPYLKKSNSKEEEMAKVLGEIERLARESQVRLVKIKPRGTQDKEFYEEYNIELEAEAAMGPLVDFLYRLNTSAQLLRAKKLRINPKDKESDVMKATVLVTRVLAP